MTRSWTTKIQSSAPVPICIGLGSNLGSSEATLQNAIQQLARFLGHPRVGPLVETTPVPESDQPDYLNTVLLGTASISPEEFLSVAKRLEWDAGRRQSARFAARVLDIDILLWGDRVIETPELSIPHPRLRSRRFVLAPLVEVAPNLRIPPDNQTVRALLDRLGDDQRVRPRPWSTPPLQS